MRQSRSIRRFGFRVSVAVPAVLVTVLSGSNAAAETLNVAVASNFAPTLSLLAADFESRTGHRLRVSRASTGKLYAQIVNGAPFDVLLAADVERPALLEASGMTVVDSRFTYAVGHLVLWSRDPRLGTEDCESALRTPGIGRIAIANPDVAPYGRAAREALIALGLWDSLRDSLVTGESVGQTLQFVASGNASLGFVAAAQLRLQELPAASCTWRVPRELYTAIEQQAVLLRRAANRPAAGEFLSFLRAPEAERVILDHGYTLAERG